MAMPRTGWPSVTVVFVVYNRRDELRTSLGKMLAESDYEGDVEVIVVDNASSDGSADMVREEFPSVRLIVRDENIGASAWNEGFAIAKGEWVLILDDDAYLPADGLTRALAAADEHGADQVSFKVISTADPDYVFSDKYRTGLFTFWGCACLIRTEALLRAGGYDPEIFIWANELELTMKLLDMGYCHLHFPDVSALHMKPPPEEEGSWIDGRGLKINANHWAYIAAKLLHRRDAAEALVALIATNIRLGLRTDPVAFKAIPENVKGFIHGLRCRQPLQHAEVSRFYRRNFETFASPWWLSRRPGELLRALPRERLRRGAGKPELGRRASYYEERARWYPTDRPATLKF